MNLDFEHHNAAGRVRVDLRVNVDPRTLGSGAGSLGLPVCTASVEVASRGYHAMCGWLQMVRSTDNSKSGHGFDMDPFAPSGTDSPYAFYGLTPTLFDAPGRDSRVDLDWLAHAFLAHTPLGTNSVEPIAGFSWGFRIRSGEVHMVPPAPLDRTDWAAHRSLLSVEYHGWTFPEMSAS